LGELESRLARLPERNRKVIELRFGLTFDGVPRTAHAVAGELGLARERVRQIELRSLTVLQAA
jgi:RNA polymerase primary sigma factor